MTMVSVIVPIYRVERYIERCVLSLMAQTLEDVEFIFVDDASDDGSIDILNRVVKQYDNRHVVILHHKTNLGLPAARNSGMAVAKGNYIYHCDSDDWLDPSLLEVLYCKAIDTGADVIWSDMVEVRTSGKVFKLQPDAHTPDSAVSKMLCSELKYNVWNKLVKTSLYDATGIKFPVGNSMGEDMTMIMLCSAANSVANVHGPCYYYNMINSSAMTQSLTNAKLKSLYNNIVRVDEYLLKTRGDLFEKEMDYFKLNAKWPFLIYNFNRKMMHLWADWFPEANKSIWSQHVSIRIRLVNWLASKRLYGMIYFHYLFVIKLCYKVLFRQA